jgi:hypothetical protein
MPIPQHLQMKSPGSGPGFQITRDASHPEIGAESHRMALTDGAPAKLRKPQAWVDLWCRRYNAIGHDAARVGDAESLLKENRS